MRTTNGTSRGGGRDGEARWRRHARAFTLTEALIASVESYSIKRVEELYGFRRTADVSGGSASIVNFEAWLETGERSLLDEIRAYAKARLSTYKVPKSIEIVDAIPRSAATKVNRGALLAARGG